MGRMVEEEDDEIYHEGVLLEREEAGDRLMEFWKGVLGNEYFNTEGVWSREMRDELMGIYEAEMERLWWDNEIDEFGNREIMPMAKPILTEGLLMDNLRKAGSGKVAGPSKLKNEMFGVIVRE